MSRRISESVKIIEQAQFNAAEKLSSRAQNCAECLLTTSSKYGIAIVAKCDELLVLSLVKLEETFQGGEEQAIPAGAVIATCKFSSEVNFLALSPDSEFIAIQYQNTIEIHHTTFLSKKVCFCTLKMNRFWLHY